MGGLARQLMGAPDCEAAMPKSMLFVLELTLLLGMPQEHAV